MGVMVMVVVAHKEIEIERNDEHRTSPLPQALGITTTIRIRFLTHHSTPISHHTHHRSPHPLLNATTTITTKHHCYPKPHHH
jgi:hypothetical protein